MDNLPKTCKAGVVENEGPNFTMKVVEVPIPVPGPDQVLIKLNITGICYSDLHYMMNDLGLPTMSECGVQSPGHEGAGVIAAVGESVTNFKVGDRCGVKPIWDTCGACELCWDDKETYCPKARLTGLTDNGTYQQYIISPARYTSPIPDGVSDEVAAPIMCSAATIYRSIVEARLNPGDWAAFPGGGGGVGIQGIQLAKAMGLRPIGIDTGDDKRKLCLEMGAEAFIDFKTSMGVAEEIIQIADGKGVHAVFVTAPQAYRDASLFVGSRIGAKIMCIGLPPVGTVLLGADPGRFIMKNFTIMGTLVGSMRDTAKALEFARRGLLKPIYEKFSIDQLPEAVDKLRAGKVAGRCIVDFNI